MLTCKWRLYEQIKRQKSMDSEYKQLMRFCQCEPIEWKESLKKYQHVKSELSVLDGLLLRGIRVVIPTSMQADMLQRLHTGHQGTTNCRQRAKESMCWPKIKQDIETTVFKCEICCQHRIQRTEPFVPLNLATRPWQRIGTDLFEWKKSNYLLVIDYLLLEVRWDC